MNDCCEPDFEEAFPTGDPTGDEADERLARLARGLAHPARVRILRLLASREGCFCGEIVDAFDLAQSTISQHLKVLKEAGLVRGQVEGPSICYCLSPAGLRQVQRLVAAIGERAGDHPMAAEELAASP